MPVLFIVDAGIYAFSTIVSFALTLIVFGVNPRSVSNIFFSLYTLTTGCWTAFALLMRMALWYEIGNPDALGTVAAIEIIKQHKQTLNLLLTDVIMPGAVDSFQLGQYIKHENPQARLIYMSGYTENNRLLNDLKEKTINFIQKPFDAKTLLRKIEEVFRQEGD